MQRALNAFLHPLPEAFLIGAQRSGTTFLHGAITQSPEVKRGVAKEPHFFSINWDKGLDFYRDRLPLRWPGWMYRCAGQKRPIAIDATPLYLFDPEAPKRVSQIVSVEARYIVLLREPGARAWSHYQMMLSRGWEHLGFLEAIEQEEARTLGERASVLDRNSHSGFRHYSYVGRGMYAEQLKRWWALVPRDRFLLLRSEDLYRDPGTTLNMVLGFLGLAAITLETEPDHNAYTRTAMPPRMRARLDAIFTEPNRELYELTGISWNPASSCGSMPA